MDTQIIHNIIVIWSYQCIINNYTLDIKIEYIIMFNSVNCVLYYHNFRTSNNLLQRNVVKSSLPEHKQSC